MKSRSISTLSLALVISIAPALQANEQESSSWLAPFSTKTCMYSAIGLGMGYVVYTLYKKYYPSELTVIAPWHEEDRVIEQPLVAMMPQEALQTDGKQAQDLTIDTVHTIIQSGLDLFVQAHGPELVSLHQELKDTDLSLEKQQEINEAIRALEQESPPLEQTVPALMVYLSLLSVVQDELQSQTSHKKSTRTPEYNATQEAITTIFAFVSNYIEIYGKHIQADFMNEFNEQLEREFHEYTQAHAL
ncbi:MAG: hypothetical protein AB7F19_06915 [Candidatus Babeliales bacterium]